MTGALGRAHEAGVALGTPVVALAYRAPAPRPCMGRPLMPPMPCCAPTLSWGMAHGPRSPRINSNPPPTALERVTLCDQLDATRRFTLDHHDRRPERPLLGTHLLESGFAERLIQSRRA